MRLGRLTKGIIVLALMLSVLAAPVFAATKLQVASWWSFEAAVHSMRLNRLLRPNTLTLSLSMFRSHPRSIIPRF